jgi:hypothetical protein
MSEQLVSTEHSLTGTCGEAGDGVKVYYSTCSCGWQSGDCNSRLQAELTWDFHKDSIRANLLKTK